MFPRDLHYNVFRFCPMIPTAFLRPCTFHDQVKERETKGYTVRSCCREEGTSTGRLGIMRVPSLLSTEGPKYDDENGTGRVVGDARGLCSPSREMVAVASRCTFDSIGHAESEGSNTQGGMPSFSTTSIENSGRVCGSPQPSTRSTRRLPSCDDLSNAGRTAASLPGHVTQGSSARHQAEKIHPGLRGEKSKVADGEEGGKDSSSSEDEDYNSSVKTDSFGFFVTSERRGMDVPQQTARVRRLKDHRRTEKWLIMIDDFDGWQKGRKARRFLRRVRKGIPDCVRGKVWQMMMGSMSMMDNEPNRYADLLASDLVVEGPIEEDIPRTMYDHELFCRKSRVDGREMLRRVLTAYGRYDREVQYCQGMNYICALFLLYMPEENAFWLLVASMQRPRAPLRELFLPGMLKAQEFQFVVDSLTEKHCPKLSAQILANNLTPAMYATQWFLTAFTQRFPYELVTRVWDMFLLEDWKVFYRVCLALFKSVEKKAIHLDLENMNLLLRNMPPKADARKVLEIAANIPLKHRHIEKRSIHFHGRAVDA